VAKICYTGQKNHLPIQTTYLTLYFLNNSSALQLVLINQVHRPDLFKKAQVHLALAL